MVWGASRLDDLLLHHLTILTRYSLHLTRLELHTPHHVVLMTIGFLANTLTLTIDKQFHLIGMIVIGP